jgi:TolB-like protein/Tfp pilus assembly protein PilF
MVEERIQRRLAAILAADVVGYSRFMERNEVGTLTALKKRRKEVLEPLVGHHQGRVFKITGDGVLVEFSSAVNAVLCAIDLQQGMAAANGKAPEDQRFVLRVGVNLGDVMVEGGDLYGDGVNIAARLEGIAQAGEVLVSGSAYDQVKNKIETGFEDLGARSLKNIDEPVRVFRVGLSGKAILTRSALALPDKPSIAVLPFANISNDPQQEYFADGMVEEIITALSRFRSLFVIARNSSFTYKGRVVDVKRIGRELGVRYVLEGSVRRSDDRLRISGQLIDASTGMHLWADRFEGALAEVFDLQDQVATSVVGAITPTLEQAEILRAKRKPTASLDAYDHYLRGLAILTSITRETNEEALRLFNKAIEQDPEFGLAYARAAHCYVYKKANRWMRDPKREAAEAAALARRAVNSGRDDADVLSFAGYVLGYLAGDLDDCAACIDRALVLNPNLAAAWGFSGWTKYCLGEPDTAIRHVAHAMRLSPLDPRIYTWQGITAFAHMFAERYDEAASWAERALRDQPNVAAVLRAAAASYALGGRIAEAEKTMERLRQLDPGLRVSNLEEVMPPFRRPEDRSKYIEGLRKAGLPE